MFAIVVCVALDGRKPDVCVGDTAREVKTAATNCIIVHILPAWSDIYLSQGNQPTCRRGGRGIMPHATSLTARDDAGDISARQRQRPTTLCQSFQPDPMQWPNGPMAQCYGPNSITQGINDLPTQNGQKKASRESHGETDVLHAYLPRTYLLGNNPREYEYSERAV